MILLTGSVNPQSAGLGGPLSGFVYAPASRTIRPLVGIPGAAYAGPSIIQEADWASIAPGGAWAFVAKSRRAGTFVHGLSTLSPTPVSVDGIIPGVDRVAWSRDGSYALAYASSANQLQRVAFSAGSGSADPPLDLTPWGQAGTLAIDPTGQRIAFGIVGSGVFLFTAGQSPVLVSPVTQPVALAFDDTGLHLYAVDLGQQQIVEFDSTGAQVLFASLTHPGEPVPNPVGLAVSGGGRYLLLADSAGRSVLVYEIASQTLVNTILLNFAPTRLEALSSAPSFVLNGSNPKEWLLILDATQTPAVYFVPATQETR